MRTISGAAKALVRNEISSVALLGEVLAALAADGDCFHAMLTLNPLAHLEAEAADRARARGETLGPLHGIPLVLKDNIDVVGIPTTSGCRALAGALPLRSASVTERLRAAGAVLVGKTNLSEFSFEIRSLSSLGGHVLNPRAPHATAGGSSGGAAVAVARGYALGAIGTDTGGSIRIPAAFNGLAGFRPPHGAVPMDGIAPLAPSTDTVGPIARTCADLRILLDVLGVPVAQADAAGLRIGVMRELFGPDPRVRAICELALTGLAERGVILIDLDPLPDALNPGRGDHIVDAEFAVSFDSYLQKNFRVGTAPASLEDIIDSGAFLPEHGQAMRQRLAVKGRDTAPIITQHRLLATHIANVCKELTLDALAYPTSQAIPDSLDNPRGGWAPELAARTGWPALSVCGGMTADGMPVGIEFLAETGREAALFALGEAVAPSGT